MESLGDVPLVVAKWEGKKEEIGEKIPLSRGIPRANFYPLIEWRGWPEGRIPDRFGRAWGSIRQFTDVRRNWFRGDRNYFFGKSRFSPSASSAFYFSHYSFSYRGFLVLRVAMWLASRVPYSTSLQRYGESLVRLWGSMGIVDCAETEVTFSNFSLLYIEWETQFYSPSYRVSLLSIKLSIKPTCLACLIQQDKRNSSNLSKLLHFITM